MHGIDKKPIQHYLLPPKEGSFASLTLYANFISATWFWSSCFSKLTLCSPISDSTTRNYFKMSHIKPRTGTFDHLYRPYYMHALKQTIQPLHTTVSSMPVVTAASQMCCEISFVSLCQTSRINLAAVRAKFIGRALTGAERKWQLCNTHTLPCPGKAQLYPSLTKQNKWICPSVSRGLPVFKRKRYKGRIFSIALQAVSPLLPAERS